MSKRARLHIGRGVHLQLIGTFSCLSNLKYSRLKLRSYLFIIIKYLGEGDVYLSCVSEHSIFIQSHYLDWMAGKEPGKLLNKVIKNTFNETFIFFLGKVVHKMHKGAEFKVFFKAIFH